MTTILRNVQHHGGRIVAVGTRTTDAAGLTVTGDERAVGRFLVRDEPPTQSTLAAEAAATRDLIRQINQRTREFYSRR